MEYLSKFSSIIKAFSFNNLKTPNINVMQFLKLKYMLPIILGLSPALGFAANLFEPSSGDVSLKVLGALFGGLMDNAPNAADPMLAAIKVFNGGILIIGGILAAYTILAGTLGTAHDGEMLGKKFSSVWIPVRYSLGTALVLPVVGGGYCVMQAIVMWLIVQGVGLADQVWSSYMANPTATANVSTSTLTENTMLEVTQNIFKSAVCYKSYAKAAADSDSSLRWTDFKYSKIEKPNGYHFGDASFIPRHTICGVVNFPKNSNPDVIVANSATTTNPGYLGDLGATFAPVDMSSISQAHKTQVEALITKMEALADTAIANPNMNTAEATAIYTQIEAASKAYVAAIKTAALAVSSEGGFEQIKQTAQNQGWILAGAWFTRIIQLNERVQKAVNSTPTATFSHNSKHAALFADASKYLATMNTVLSVGNDDGDVISLDKNASTDKRNGDGEIKEAGAVMQKVSAYITKAMTGIDFYQLKNDSRHPLIIVHDVGAHIVFGTLGLMIVVGGIAGGIGFLAGGTVQSVIMIIQMFIGFPIQALTTVALACQYIIPNLPYMIWIGCIVGWVLLVVESIIAAPLWAIMHLHPNGDDMTGRGGNGYMLVLSLLLRPVLMIFGMMAAIVISAVIGEFINKTFFDVFSSDTLAFNGFAAILGLFMGTVLYFIVMLTFVRKCFGIMHQLPDQLLRWIGGGDNTLGQFAGEFNQAAERAAGAGAVVMGGIGAKGAQMIGEKGIQKGNRMLEQMGSKEGSSNSGAAGFLARHSAGFGRDGVGEDGQVRSSIGERSFSQQKEQMENDSLNRSLESFTGAGGAGIRDNAMQGVQFGGAGTGNSPKDFKSAYNNSVIGAHLTSGGDKGMASAASSEILQQFEGAKVNGFSEFGGSATQAMTSIAQNVNTGNIEQRMSDYSGASDFIKNQAGNGSVVTDYQAGNMYANSIPKIAEKAGSDIMDVINQSSNPAAEFKNAYDKYK